MLPACASKVSVTEAIPQRLAAHSLAVIIIMPYDCYAHIIKDHFIRCHPLGKLSGLLTERQSQRAAPLGIPPSFACPFQYCVVGFVFLPILLNANDV